MPSSMQDITAKVQSGARLSADEGLMLLQTSDLWQLGRLAHLARTRLHGANTYYNINRHLNYTNLCALSCQFCSFYRKKDDPRGGVYEMTIEQIAQQAQQAQLDGATEIHIVGGLHPYMPFSYYTDMLRGIREAAPKLHIKAFTAVEIVHLARIAKRPHDLEGILKELREAGLGSLPGGGAEVFDDRVHDQAFKGKIRSDRWLDVHRTAHKLGLWSNATILYGHIESHEDRIHHLCLLRQAQDEAIAAHHPARFQTVIPLPFIPDDSALQNLPGPCGIDDLRMLGVSRLMLDNFAHVKAFWIMQTLPLAQLSLQFGVDDIDGTVVWYDITKVGGTTTHQEVDVNALRRAIRDAGMIPVERDTLYRQVIRQGANWNVMNNDLVKDASGSPTSC
ncbi:MAG: aminofutalosine synthase MqnE [Phycisphaerales bacterium]|nr:aminofutalosine synthase MqnE [Phycisphaerales bacterium]